MEYHGSLQVICNSIASIAMYQADSCPVVAYYGIFNRGLPIKLYWYWSLSHFNPSWLSMSSPIGCHLTPLGMFNSQHLSSVHNLISCLQFLLYLQNMVNMLIPFINKYGCLRQVISSKKLFPFWCMMLKKNSTKSPRGHLINKVYSASVFLMVFACYDMYICNSLMAKMSVTVWWQKSWHLQNYMQMNS